MAPKTNPKSTDAAEDIPDRKEYDLIIIGGGPAGLSAAIYASRFNLDFFVAAKEFGGLLTTTHLVENWPGFAQISGRALMDRIIEHCRHFNIMLKEAEVTGIKKKGSFFYVKTGGSGGAHSKKEAEHRAKAVILATGSKPRQLGIPGETEFLSRGVSYCATCDAMFFKNKAVAVIGGNDSAAKEALMLSEHCKKVYIIYRKEKIRAEPINAERVEKNPKIEIINNTNVIEIKGKNKVERLILDKPYKGSKEFSVDGVFIEIGHNPLSELAGQMGVSVNEKGEIIADNGSRTNVEGFYAAGDITDSSYKQAITAAADGVKAAFSAFEYVKKFKD